MSKNRPPLFGGFLANVPRQIDAESNPRCPHVAGFPRNLLYTAIEPSGAKGRPPIVRDACYWPDLDSYRDDAGTREMRYAPREESPYSVRVVHDKATGFWETFKYRGDTRVCVAHGADFRHAMIDHGRGRARRAHDDCDAAG